MRTPGLDAPDKRVHCVFRADEYALLLDQVKASGLSITDVLRCLVRRGAAEAWWTPPANPKIARAVANVKKATPR